MSVPFRTVIALLLAGALLAGVGLVTKGSEDVAAQEDPRTSTASLNPVTGLAPIERVVAHFEARAEAGPSDYLSRTQLGFAMLTQAQEQADLERYENAQAVFEEALTLNEQHVPAQLGLAQALHAQHEFAAALDLALEVREARPDLLSADLLVADARLELGQVEEAALIYDELALVERSAVTVSRQARLAAAEGRDNEAVDFAMEALELSDEQPLRPNARAFYRFQVAHFSWAIGDAEQALGSLSEARQIDAGHVGSIELEGEIYREQGELVLAAERYEELLASGPAADLHGHYADIQRELGNAELAAEHEELGMALALETIERFPAERSHVIGFLVTRDVELAVELAQQEVAERPTADSYELLAEAEAALAAAS